MDNIVVETAGWIRGQSDVETVSVTLTFNVNDPFAVCMDIAGHLTVESWIFSRDLLADGLRSMVPLGEGSITIQATSVLTEITHESISSPDDEPVTLRLPWWNTREFIRLTQVAVARGAETYDIDSLLDDIFDPPGSVHS